MCAVCVCVCVLRPTSASAATQFMDFRGCCALGAVWVSCRCIPAAATCVVLYYARTSLPAHREQERDPQHICTHIRGYVGWEVGGWCDVCVCVCVALIGSRSVGKFRFGIRLPDSELLVDVCVCLCVPCGRLELAWLPVSDSVHLRLGGFRVYSVRHRTVVGFGEHEKCVRGIEVCMSN